MTWIVIWWLVFRPSVTFTSALCIQYDESRSSETPQGDRRLTVCWASPCSGMSSSSFSLVEFFGDFSLAPFLSFESGILVHRRLLLTGRSAGGFRRLNWGPKHCSHTHYYSLGYSRALWTGGFRRPNDGGPRQSVKKSAWPVGARQVSVHCVTALGSTGGASRLDKRTSEKAQVSYLNIQRTYQTNSPPSSHLSTLTPTPNTHTHPTPFLPRPTTTTPPS